MKNTWTAVDFEPLSSTKIVVNKEELEELLPCSFRMKTPDEIKRYQKIISNKDAILADAQSKADAIVAEAREKTQNMVTESEIMREATEQANDLLERTNQQAQEILDNATNDANNIRMGALQYTDDMLANLEKIMSHTIDGAGAKYNNFINAIQSCYDIVSKNRSELEIASGSPHQLWGSGDHGGRSGESMTSSRRKTNFVRAGSLSEKSGRQL